MLFRSYPDDVFFQEFVVRCPKPVPTLDAALRQRGIVGGLDVSTATEARMLLCATEVTTREEIDRLGAALAEVAA